MIPIIWRFLLFQYLKVVILCVIAFVAILLTARLDDIAHFAALGASAQVVFLFVLYQIPYILPVAIPIACLISAILLVQRLSQTHELTALRASGLALRDFIAPILIASALLALVNFYIVSELATTTHLSTSLWKTELRSINPMLLLRNKHLMRLKGGYFETMGDSCLGESAQEVVIAMPNKNQSRIGLLLADEMKGNQNTFQSKGITLITTMAADEQDQLVIENIAESQTSTQDFSQIMQRKVWSVNNDHLHMSLLLSRLQEEKEALVHAQKETSHAPELKSIKKNINRCYSEIIRRASVAFAVFTFTLMGTAFGIRTSRTCSSKPICYVICLASIYLIAYFMAKGIDHRLLLSTLMYTVPHVLLIAISIWMLKRISKGIER